MLLMLPEQAQSQACCVPQMGRQLHGVLMNHMQRYSYSATGALRWKRDMTEYCDWVHSLRAPLVDEKFEELQVRRSLRTVAIYGLHRPCMPNV